jgi:hypothetical protein
MALTEHRAEQLAALAGIPRLVLPPPVDAAIRRWQAVQALPHPPMPERGAEQRATYAFADQLARQAAIPQVPLDVTPIMQAIQDDAAAISRVNLDRQWRDAESRGLIETFDSHRGQVITTIQAHHGKQMTDLAGHARQLPDSVDEHMALEQGGQVRVHYLGCRDLTAVVARLRDAIATVEDHPQFDISDSLEACLMYERTGRLYRAWLGPSGTSIHGDPGSFAFWVSACREPSFEWWLPSAAELRARAAQLREQMHANRVRGGLDPAHVF